MKYTVAIFFGGEVYQNIVCLLSKACSCDIFMLSRASVISLHDIGGPLPFSRFPLWAETFNHKVILVNAHKYNMYVHTITYIIISI